MATVAVRSASAKLPEMRIVILPLVAALFLSAGCKGPNPRNRLSDEALAKMTTGMPQSGFLAQYPEAVPLKSSTVAGHGITGFQLNYLHRSTRLSTYDDMYFYLAY